MGRNPGAICGSPIISPDSMACFGTAYPRALTWTVRDIPHRLDSGRAYRFYICCPCLASRCSEALVQELTSRNGGALNEDNCVDFDLVFRPFVVPLGGSASRIRCRRSE